MTQQVVSVLCLSDTGILRQFVGQAEVGAGIDGLRKDIGITRCPGTVDGNGIVPYLVIGRIDTDTVDHADIIGNHGLINSLQNAAAADNPGIAGCNPAVVNPADIGPVAGVIQPVEFPVVKLVTLAGRDRPQVSQQLSVIVVLGQYDAVFLIGACQVELGGIIVCVASADFPAVIVAVDYHIVGFAGEYRSIGRVSDLVAFGNEIRVVADFPAFSVNPADKVAVFTGSVSSV